MNTFTSLEAFKTRYDIGAKLGEGGFGKVYRVYDKVLDRRFAVKISDVNPDKSKYRLANEVALAAKLMHPNIAKYEACFTFPVDGELKDYAIMQYYSLGNLDMYLSNNSVTASQKADLVSGILEGVKYLHDQKIVHRDLKSANILVVVREDGTIVPKISDFGISRSFEADGQSRFQNSTSAGTVAYSSPEQLRGAKTLRPNTDLWSVGIIIYRIFMGKTPFALSGDSSEVERVAVINRIIEGVLPADISKVPEPFYEVMRRCLVVDSGERIRSAEECIHLLKTNYGQGTPTTPVESGKPKNRHFNASKGQFNWRLYVGLAAIPVVLLLWWAYSYYSVPHIDAYAKKGFNFDYGMGIEKIDEKKGFEYYKQSAEKGNPFGQALWATYLLYGGADNPKDSLKASSLASQALLPLQKAAEWNDPLAQCLVGWIYAAGLTGVKDDKKAVEWWQKAAKKDFVLAQYDLANSYWDGKGVKKDTLKAVELYRKASEQKLADAENELGACYEKGFGVEKDTTKAIEWYRKAAEQGEKWGQYNLGNCYYYKKDYKNAIEWYRKAADQGSANAKNSLGVCYAVGKGVEKDAIKAVEWYRKAAEQGDSWGQYNLAECYNSGEGVNKDYKKAIEWYQKAVEQGNSTAQYQLGTYYYNGKGVEKDYKKAVELFQKSADQGHEWGQAYLGLCYYAGNGVKQNYQKTVYWYEKSANQGNRIVQYPLGECYEEGLGVDKNVNKAIQLYQQAAAEGNENAKKRLKELGY